MKFIEIPVLYYNNRTDYEAMNIEVPEDEIETYNTVINTNSIVSFWPEAENKTNVTTIDGDLFMAEISYDHLKSLL